MRKKVSVIGAGAVGSLVAFNIASKDLADVVLLDIIEGVPQGKALDLMQSLPVFSSSAKVFGSNDYSVSKDSDIVVVTAGLPRKPGMTRDDLVEINSKIFRSVIPEVVKFSPDCILIIVTNPLSAMVKLAYDLSGFPKERVLGMAGVLDSSRFKAFISEKTNVPVSKIQAFVLGDHGDLMVPLISSSKIDGKSLSEILSEKDIDDVISRVRNAGGEIISLLKNASTSFAPATAIFKMIDCILNNKDEEILPCSVLLEGEYGINNLFVGVPVRLCNSGIKEIVELDLSASEKELFNKSVSHIQELVSKL